MIRHSGWPAIVARIGQVPIVAALVPGTNDMPDPGEIEADVVLQAIRSLGLVKTNRLRKTGSMGWVYDITCPWIDHHTNGMDNGAAYAPAVERFECHHGSFCKNQNTGAFKARIAEMLEEAKLPSMAALAFDAVNDPSIWKRQWQRSGKNFTGNTFNVLVALRLAPEFAAAFGFNAFTAREMLLHELPNVVPGTTPGVPREWRDQDTVLVQSWLQGAGLRTVGTATVDAAVSALMHEHTYHPVRDWLKTLRWDGVPRLDTWLHRYLGTHDTAYHAHIGRWWLMTMCRRVFEPGCRADYMVVLEGPQGQEKSTALRALARSPEWFSDNLPDITTKDAAEHLIGCWLVEVAEMDRFDRTESAAMKAHITRTTDRVRLPYTKRSGDHPRQCVHAGTVNQGSYLKDETGNRRYWPVTCGVISVPGLVLARDQLFAEAWHRTVTLGEQYWPDPMFEELFIQPEQDDRLEPDPWEHLVLDYLHHKTRALVYEVIAACTGGGAHNLNRANSNRVAKIMGTLRWRRGGKGKRGPNGERFWYPA